MELVRHGSMPSRTLLESVNIVLEGLEPQEGSLDLSELHLGDNGMADGIQVYVCISSFCTDQLFRRGR
jgi:hypothetical protein